MSLEVGQIIDGKYRIVRLLGEGGMGAVFEGENVRINRRVAIKVLHAGFTENREVTQRFEREAQAAGRIGNDHILQVLDLGSLPTGDSFIVMEYLDGEPLSNRIKRQGRLQPFELASIIRQVLVGLGAAHEAGIVHRDLKPDNIYILKSLAGRADFVKIIDFGISKFQPLSGGDGMKMTRTGVVMGTPYYMSPEQASGSSDADARSDIYSVGVIMFEAVTGQVPFDAETFNQLMFKIVLSEVPAPEAVVPGLDPAFSSIVSKAMARDANARFQSTPEFIEALDAWLAHGAAVPLAPAADRASLAHIALDARGGLGSATNAGSPRPTQPNTPADWAAASQLGEEPVKRRASGSVLVAAAAAMAIIGVAGALVAVLGGKKDAADTATATNSSAALATTAAATSTNASAAAVSLQATAIAPTVAVPAPAVTASAPTVAAPATQDVPAPRVPSPHVATRAAAPHPAVRPVQHAAPVPAAPVETANKPRRTTRDFGY